MSYNSSTCSTGANGYGTEFIAACWSLTDLTGNLWSMFRITNYNRFSFLNGNIEVKRLAKICWFWSYIIYRGTYSIHQWTKNCICIIEYLCVLSYIGFVSASVDGETVLSLIFLLCFKERHVASDTFYNISQKLYTQYTYCAKYARLLCTKIMDGFPLLQPVFLGLWHFLLNQVLEFYRKS